MNNIEKLNRLESFKFYMLNDKYVKRRKDTEMSSTSQDEIHSQYRKSRKYLKLIKSYNFQIKSYLHKFDKKNPFNNNNKILIKPVQEWRNLSVLLDKSFFVLFAFVTFISIIIMYFKIIVF